MSILDSSVQINNGFTETSADGASLTFDSKYGIMFCAYMPGKHGCYGESRGRIALSYFPASQPTNIRFVTISEDTDVYCNNILGLGEGAVRIFYEKNSRADGDHEYCYRDFDFLGEKLSEEKRVMALSEDGVLSPLCLSLQFRYLENNGYSNHKYEKSEQIGHCAYFKGEDGYIYGAALSFYSEAILYRSRDNGGTVEFFAVYPLPVQYEFEYKIHNGKIYALYRTDRETDSIFFTFSEDMGKSWEKPVALSGSIQCRPRLLIYNRQLLICYNYYDNDTEGRPPIQQGRSSVRLIYGDIADPNKNLTVADIHSKYGIVNVCLCDIMNDIYLAYSTSELALEHQNGNPKVRGKDAIRYVKLGELIPKGEKNTYVLR